MRLVDLADDLEALGNGGQKVFRVFFRVDVFEQQADVFPLDELRRALQTFDTTLVHLLVREPRHAVSRHHDDGITLDLFHDGQFRLEVRKKGFPGFGVGDAVAKPSRHVEGQPQLALLFDRVLELVLRPAFVFAHKLDVVVARLSDFFQPLFERQFVEYRPEHHRELERHAQRFALLSARPARHGGPRSKTPSSGGNSIAP